ncbi:Uncharacterized conserved protein, contains GH25 family domain [Desulfonauticus submarinus]|uniref:Uncharacterized conserved protein, contains GH25 family domain n=1 Tax=Desulfonauticus submarinus TaxID=206665 RepID=A0A1H0ABD3_9BACT|nr:DUF4198 domain-containing protein [Desulfonauticus submarinus]SDN30604.1 Uncharacterized conserved protein, contains GH25 family domain [Desulfonauticus submarinus]
MNCFKKIFIFTMLIVGYLFSNQASAHEFIVKPYFFSLPQPGENPFSIVSSHIYMLSEEVEPLDKVEVYLIGPDTNQKINLQPNQTLYTLDGKVMLTEPGMFYLKAHRKGMIWTKTTKGWVQKSKKGLKGVLKSGLYEKFSKALIKVGENTNFYKKPLGQTLEIIPLKNPYQLKPGDILPVKVLLQGKPINTEIMASYDRFSMHPNTYAYLTEAQDNGIGYVKISSPGVWMVRVQVEKKVNSKDYDAHVMRATLIFEVR